METVTLDTTYPCCGGPSHIKRIVGLPHERYDRKCPRCGGRWRVDVYTVTARPGVRVDRTEWDCTPEAVGTK